MSRILKVGMIGGGLNSFMGDIHRKAIELSGCLDLVCGAFGSTRNSSYETGKKLNLPTRRVYGIYRDMFRRENMLSEKDRMDFVTIVAPNAMHYPISMSALDARFPVFTEKPFTCNLDEAMNLKRKQQNNSVPYGISMVYPNYSILHRVRETLLKGKFIGSLRKIVFQNSLGWMAPRLENAGNRQACWRTDPRRSGPVGCLADLCAPCFYLAEWLTGLTITDVCGDMAATVPGRILDDDCIVMTRFSNGLHGVFMASQVDTGSADGMVFKLIGDKGTLLWKERTPNHLTFIHVDGTTELIRSKKAKDLAVDEELKKETGVICPPTPFGNNAAYIHALAESYKAFAQYVTTLKAGKSYEKDPGFMTVDEGLRSVVFVDSMIKNMEEPPPDDAGNIPPQSKWTPIVIPEIREL